MLGSVDVSQRPVDVVRCRVIQRREAVERAAAVVDEHEVDAATGCIRRSLRGSERDAELVRSRCHAVAVVSRAVEVGDNNPIQANFDLEGRSRIALNVCVHGKGRTLGHEKRRLTYHAHGRGTLRVTRLARRLTAGGADEVRTADVDHLLAHAGDNGGTRWAGDAHGVAAERGSSPARTAARAAVGLIVLDVGAGARAAELVVGAAETTTTTRVGAARGAAGAAVVVVVVEQRAEACRARACASVGPGVACGRRRGPALAERSLALEHASSGTTHRAKATDVAAPAAVVVVGRRGGACRSALGRTRGAGERAGARVAHLALCALGTAGSAVVAVGLVVDAGGAAFVGPARAEETASARATNFARRASFAAGTAVVAVGAGVGTVGAACGLWGRARRRNRAVKLRTNRTVEGWDHAAIGQSSNHGCDISGTTCNIHGCHYGQRKCGAQELSESFHWPGWEHEPQHHVHLVMQKCDINPHFSIISAKRTNETACIPLRAIR